MTVNGDLKVMSGGRIFLDTREIKPAGGSGAVFSIPEDGITNTGVITKIKLRMVVVVMIRVQQILYSQLLDLLQEKYSHQKVVKQVHLPQLLRMVS